MSVSVNYNKLTEYTPQSFPSGQRPYSIQFWNISELKPLNDSCTFSNPFCPIGIFSTADRAFFTAEVIRDYFTISNGDGLTPFPITAGYRIQIDNVVEPRWTNYSGQVDVFQTSHMANLNKITYPSNYTVTTIPEYVIDNADGSLPVYRVPEHLMSAQTTISNFSSMLDLLGQDIGQVMYPANSTIQFLTGSEEFYLICAVMNGNNIPYFNVIGV